MIFQIAGKAAKLWRAVKTARRLSREITLWGVAGRASRATRLLPTFDRVLAPLVAGVALTILVLEWRRPLRGRHFRGLDAARRIAKNALLALPAVGTARLVMLPVPLAAASWAMRRNLGLLNVLPLPMPVKIALGVLLFDWAYYWWHRFTHLVPVLWRFHNVHHSDMDMDTSTAARFHFLDIGFSTVYRSGVVVVFGLSPSAVLVFDALFSAAVTFQHSNWRLPIGVERRLARVVVTPRLHGIHHSIVQAETNSNWSNILSCWDKIHGTYRDDVPQDEIIIGVPAHRDEREMSAIELFLLPFRPLRAWQLPDGTVPEREAQPASDLAP